MYKGGRGGGNPFDEDDDSGFGTRSSSGGGYGSGPPRDPMRGQGGGRAGPGPQQRAGGGYGGSYGGGGGGYGGTGGGYGGGYDSGPSYGRDDPPLDYDTRMMMANRRMEESSANSLRVLNETMRTGVDTTEELERQAESLDRTERRLDEMHVDLDRGEQSMRKIKSPFGGISNYFTRKKKVEEVTDPKALRSKSGPPPVDTKAQKKAAQKQKQQQQQPPAQGTGNAVVDSNLDEMSKALDQLHGIGQVISYQLDDSDRQLDRIGYKMERNHVKVDKLNKDIKRELYK